MPVELIDMVLGAVSGPRPAWGRSSEHPSVLVETARGEVGLRAGVRVLEEYLKRTGTVALEVARSRTSDGNHEAVYVRCGSPPVEEAAPTADMQQLQDAAGQLERATAELSQAILGEKP